MGGVPEGNYSNSKEAFLEYYEKGCRAFEVDLWFTSDNALVAFHDGHERILGLNSGFTKEQFLSAKIYKKYTSIDLIELGMLMRDYPDWTLVTDTKAELIPSLLRLCEVFKTFNVSCSERVLPQIYSVEDIAKVKTLGFERIIFTLYRARLDDTQVVEAVRKHPEVIAVTAHTSRFNEALAARLRDEGVVTYVHTVNEPSQIHSFRTKGAHGVYTDTGCP